MLLQNIDSTSNTEKIIKLLEILKSHSDAENPITITKTLDLLAEDNCILERKTLSNYIEDFYELGLVSYSEAKQAGKTAKFYYAKFPFTRSEFKLLRDALAASRLVSLEDTSILIDKLESLASEKQLEYISPNGVPTHYRNKRPADNVFRTIDIIQQAIKDNKQIQFQYTAYNILKQLVPRQNSKLFMASPHYLVWSDDAYYVITKSDSHHDARFAVVFRVDRILNAEIVNIPRESMPENFKIDEFVRAQLNMYAGGITKRVKVEFTFDLLSVVIDQFGEDIYIKENGENKFIAEFDVVISQMFYSWIFRFGNRAKVLFPQDVVDGYKAAIREQLNEFEPLKFLYRFSNR